MNCRNSSSPPRIARWWQKLTLLGAALALFGSVSAQTVVTLTATSQTWTVPAGVTSATVYVWGAGGGAGGSNTGSWFANGGGGGGGANVSSTVAVNPGEIYTLTALGAGGTGGANGTTAGGAGGSTTFSGPAGVWVADGGLGGAPSAGGGGAHAGGNGATTGSGPGVTIRAGGNGSAGNDGVSSGTGITGTGGGGGGSTGNGTSPASTCAAVGTGGTGTYPGGNGGDATQCGTTTNATGPAGAVFGGGGGGANCWTSTFAGGAGGAGRVVIVFAGPPANDDPCGAVALTVGGACSFSTPSWTSATATVLAGLPAPTCADYSTGDVWFSCVVPASGKLQIDMNTGSITDSGMEWYTATSCSGTFTSLECDDDDSPNGFMSYISRTGLTPGATIYVRVWDYNDATSGSLQICAFDPIPDDPCGATTLTVGTSCSFSAQSWVGATATVLAGLPSPTCASYSTGDVWFTCVVPATGNLKVELNTGSITDSGMEWYTATACNGTFTSLECDDDDGILAMSSISRTGLTPGATIYIRVWDYNDATSGSLSICVYDDTPACAPPAGLAASAITGVGANISWTCGACVGTYVLEYGPSATFTTPGTGLAAGVGGTVITSAVSPQPIGVLLSATQYRVFVRQNCGGGVFSANSTALLFNTAVSNESCATAISVPVAASLGACVSTLFTTGATQDGPNAACSATSGNIPDDDVWYSFVAPAGTNKLIMTTTAGTTSDCVMQLWDGCPGTGNLLGCDDDGGVGFMPELSLCSYTPGATYYIRLWTYTAGGSGSTANLCVYQDIPCPPPPGNDACGSPATLTLGTCPANQVAGTTVDATAGTDPSPSCELFAGKNDVWYTVTTGPCSATMTVTVTNTGAGLAEWALYTAYTCVTGGTQLACTNGAGSSTVAVTPNTAYRVRVWSNPGAATTFTVCAAEASVLTLDTDGDLTTDCADTDDDNDGVADGSDPQPLNTAFCGLDADSDGCDDCAGTNDGFGAAANNFPASDGLDTDSDGACNFGDLDDDGDGIPDAAEITCGSDPLNAASTCEVCDGTDNDLDASVDEGFTNTDGDAQADCVDTDDDNDGIADGGDPIPLNPDLCGDADFDGCDDCSVGTDNFGPLADNLPVNDGLDTDGDILCNFGDLDDDNDGILDGSDPQPLNNFICGDSDNDGCDDCSVTGTSQPANDGPDTDGDGICDSGDNCLSVANPLQTNSDGDALGDACDVCPTVTNGNPGDACDDGNAFTFNDVLGSSPTCGCAGTACTQSVVITIATDGGGLRWTLRNSGNTAIVQSSPGYPAYDSPPASPNYGVTTCLPNGQFYFTLEDEDCNGIVNGGYTVTVGGKRVIDNTNNMNLGCPSQIAGNTGVNVPVGNDRLISASCDRLDLRRGVSAACSDRLTADNTPNAITPANASVYQFWIFDPNGGTSIFYPSATGVTTNQVSMFSLPSLLDNKLYNIRVRTRISPGVFRPWGTACRFMINNTLGQCPVTKLQDEVDNAHLSCGQVRALGSGAQNLIYAKPAVRFGPACGTQVATRYQFRFRLPNEAKVIVKYGVGANPWTYLNNTQNMLPAPMPYTGQVLEACKPYEVEVRASFDGGATWCVGGNATNDPYTNLAPWGSMCMLYTTLGCFDGGSQHMALEEVGSTLHLYPNPNRGDQVVLNIDEVKEGVNTVNVDIYDTFGKRVSARTIAVQDGFINTVLELHGELAAGMYLVNITAGETVYTERLVIQP